MDFPLHVGQTDVVRLHGLHIEIAVGRTVFRGIEVILARLLTGTAPAGTDSKHRQPFLSGFHPRLIADNPLQRE